MAINLKTPDFTELKPRILVFGVGGAGGNAVNNMVASRLEGVEFLVANTDSQALVHSRAHHRLQIGTKLTQGLGAGSRPDIGEAAAEESADEIRRILESSHMVFITAGMGGGTGTGAAPVIARLAKDLGILTVGVVTKPFAFEGGRRMRTADEGIDRLKEIVDTLIVIPNQNLFRIANDKTTFAKAFEMADEVLYAGVRGVTDLMVMPGLINLDFADVRTVMSEMGTAMMGMGEAEGERRAVAAAEAAISNPLLDVSSMKGARGVLINITGGLDLTLYEVDEAANKIRSEVDPDANIIVGSTFDESMNGSMRVSVVATGISAEARSQSVPVRQQAAAKDAGAKDMGAKDGARREIAQSDAARSELSHAVAMPSYSQTIQSPSALVQPAPISAMPAVAQASHPVHSMQSEIVRSGLAADVTMLSSDQMVCAPAQRGYNGMESHAIEASALDAMVSGPRQTSGAEAPRQRQALPQQLQPETRKGGGFSVFGITIGGSAMPKRQASVPVRPAATPMPAGQRQGQSSDTQRPSAPAIKTPVLSKERSEEIFNAVADDQLDIPAFLRRQAN